MVVAAKDSHDATVSEPSRWMTACAQCDTCCQCARMCETGGDGSTRTGHISHRPCKVDKAACVYTSTTLRAAGYRPVEDGRLHKAESFSTFAAPSLTSMESCKVSRHGSLQVRHNVDYTDRWPVEVEGARVTAMGSVLPIPLLC